MKQRFFIILITFCSFGCSSTPATQAYLKNQMNRSFIYPKEVRSWSTLLQTKNKHLLFYPFLWEHSLNSHIGIIWSPFPVDLKILIGESETHFSGIKISLLGESYQRVEDFIWRPTIRSFHRFFLSQKASLELESHLIARVRPKAREPLRYFPGAKLIFLCQITPPLLASASVGWENREGMGSIVPLEVLTSIVLTDNLETRLFSETHDFSHYQFGLLTSLFW